MNYFLQVKSEKNNIYLALKKNKMTKEEKELEISKMNGRRTSFIINDNIEINAYYYFKKNGDFFLIGDQLGVSPESPRHFQIDDIKKIVSVGDFNESPFVQALMPVPSEIIFSSAMLKTDKDLL